jgi:hypothetical protein
VLLGTVLIPGPYYMDVEERVHVPVNNDWEPAW